MRQWGGVRLANSSFSGKVGRSPRPSRPKSRVGRSARSRRRSRFARSVTICTSLGGNRPKTVDGEDNVVSSDTLRGASRSARRTCARTHARAPRSRMESRRACPRGIAFALRVCRSIQPARRTATDALHHTVANADRGRTVGAWLQGGDGRGGRRLRLRSRVQQGIQEIRRGATGNVARPRRRARCGIDEEKARGSGEHPRPLTRVDFDRKQEITVREFDGVEGRIRPASLAKADQSTDAKNRNQPQPTQARTTEITAMRARGIVLGSTAVIVRARTSRNAA